MKVGAEPKSCDPNCHKNCAVAVLHIAYLFAKRCLSQETAKRTFLGFESSYQLFATCLTAQ